MYGSSTKNEKIKECEKVNEDFFDFIRINKKSNKMEKIRNMHKT